MPRFYPGESWYDAISFRLAKVWFPTTWLTYLSKNIRKCSVSAYVRSLVSWGLLVSSLILTKKIPVQSPGATRLFFLSSKTFNPNTCVHTLAVGDNNNSHSTHVYPWNCSICLAWNWTWVSKTFHLSCLTASNPRTSFHQCPLVQIFSSISSGTSYFLPPSI